jgi:malonate decarboxylase alpha subunit
LIGVQIRALLAWLAYATLAYTQFLRSPRDVRGRPGASRVTSFGHVQYSVDMGSNSPGAGLAAYPNARHFVLNPHPTLIPAIEAGFVDSIYCFGSEVGMERYVASHADVFPVGSDGNLRSNRALAQVAGQYACDLFIGGTLQIDAVQMVQTRQPNGAPSFVEQLDAFDLAASAGFALPPIMIYGDDVTHVITERGVANLLRCRSPQEREAALRAVAGDTDFGKRQSPETGESLRRRGIVMFPSDLGIDVATATRDWLSAKSIDDIVTASGGLYVPPAKFRRAAITHS